MDGVFAGSHLDRLCGVRLWDNVRLLDLGEGVLCWEPNVVLLRILGRGDHPIKIGLDSDDPAVDVDSWRAGVVDFARVEAERDSLSVRMLRACTEKK